MTMPEELLYASQGGMMEEWHQKLHNNTSPDDVIICQALINYIDSGLDVSAYWATLKVVYNAKQHCVHRGKEFLTCHSILLSVSHGSAAHTLLTP